MDEVGGDLLFPHNEVAVLSAVALGPHSLELPDTPCGVRHDLGQVQTEPQTRCRVPYGVGLKPGTFAPSQVRLPGRRPCHRLIRCPAFWRIIAFTASGGLVALRNAALEL